MADSYNDSLHDELYDLFLNGAAFVLVGQISRIPYVGKPLSLVLGYQQMGKKRQNVLDIYTELTTSSQDRPNPTVANYSFWLSQGVRYYS